MSAKTVNDRQKEFRAKMKEQGLKEIRSLFAHPDDIERIRAYAAKLRNQRDKAS